MWSRQPQSRDSLNVVTPTTVQGQPEPGHANALDSVTTDRLQSFFEREYNS